MAERRGSRKTQGDKEITNAGSIGRTLRRAET